MPRNIVGKAKINPDKLQLAKELRREMTPGEKVLWKCLRTNQFHGYHFRRQQVIDGYIVDFYCHANGLIIEVNGDVHDKQKDYDSERDRVLLAHGFHILRISENAEVTNINAVLKKINTALSSISS